MRSLLCIVLFATAPALWAAKKPQPSTWSFQYRVEAEIRYDDNILGLSDREVRDMRRVEEPENDERFRIETPNDVIFNPVAGFGISRKPRKGLDTSFGLSLGAKQYGSNTIKNHNEYRLWARQDLNRSRKHRTTLTVGGLRIPSYFLRQLVDDDLSAPPNTCNTPDPNDRCHNAATYRLTTGYIELSQEIINRFLVAEARYARERRDYNHHFDGRDASSDVYSLEAKIYPLGGLGLRLRPYYQHEKRTTRGDPGALSTVAEDDAGFEGDLFGFEVRGLWGRDPEHRNTLRGYFQRESRDFTSNDPGDTGHFNREDRISKFGFGYGRGLGRNLRLDISGYHRVNDVSISSSIFAKNVFAISLGYEMER